MKVNFSSAQVLVIGDVMLDQYLVGEVKRISPEAPVPVSRITQQYETLGGAANVAANVVGLGGRCLLAGYVGQDANSAVIDQLLQKAGIQFCKESSSKPTIAKVRVLGGAHQLLRLDYEEAGAYADGCEERLLAQVLPLVASCGAVILSDYGKGVCTSSLCQAVIAEAAHHGVPVLVDPKTTDWMRYQGAFLVTPNLKEYCEVLQQEVPNQDASVAAHAQQVLGQFGLGHLLVTRSERGMSLFVGHRALHIHSEAREVFDVSGAGDTVIATIATSLAAGIPLEDAVRLANTAAGIVVSKAGTVPIQEAEMLEALRSGDAGTGKILAPADMRRIIAAEQKKGKTVVFTNGCFDILHRGHVTYLRAARQQGDLLVLGLNSDASVRRLKGPSRPVNQEMDRAFVMAALECVDFVVLFGEDTPAELLSLLRPDILVKGGDYTVDQVIGRESVREVRILDFVDGYSTTSILARSASQA